MWLKEASRGVAEREGDRRKIAESENIASESINRAQPALLSATIDFYDVT
jgi:hypothetical protein